MSTNLSRPDDLDLARGTFSPIACPESRQCAGDHEVAFPCVSGYKFQNLSDCSMDLCVTASLISSLDVIVSVDTMVAHLAGALGKKVYLLLHTEADWRWLKGREDSPWYPTVSLLRQFQAGDWKPVVNRLAYILTKMTRS